MVVGAGAKTAHTQGGSMATPETARYLQIQWEEASFVQRRSGYADAQLSVSALAQRGTPVRYGDREVQRPVMLYVYDRDMDKKKARRLLERMFKSDDLAVASRVIRFVGCPIQELPEHLTDEYGQCKPAFFLLDSDGVELERLDGAIQAGTLVRKLNRLYRTQYAGTLPDLTDRTLDALEELDELNRDLVGLEKSFADARASLDKKQTRGNENEFRKADQELSKAKAAHAELIALRDELCAPELSKERREALGLASK